METYNIVRGNGGWTIVHNGSEPEGEYATREVALEAVYLAASNDVKRGLAIAIKIDPPAPGEAAIGGANITRASLQQSNTTSTSE